MHGFGVMRALGSLFPGRWSRNVVMNIAFIVIGALVLLALLAYMVARWPASPEGGKKKLKREVPAVVEPPKEMTAAIERAERRASQLEQQLREAHAGQKEKLKEIAAMKAAMGGLERQVGQEKAWREKEEAAAAREKAQEGALRRELDKVGALLHEASNQRIRLEYEVKELRLIREALSADLSKVTGRANDLERRVKEAEATARALTVENARLQQKKEADRWVAKDDHDRVEALLKAARRDMERLRQRLPVELRDIEDNEKP